jgi:hypothetical protein
MARETNLKEYERHLCTPKERIMELKPYLIPWLGQVWKKNELLHT